MAAVTESRPAARSHTDELLGLDWDVVVIGGGNAAIVAAITARSAGARVLVLERAPFHMRGGNSRHTRNIRCARHHSDGYSPEDYPNDELWKDLCGVGDGPSDEYIARKTVDESVAVPAWMSQQGIKWQPPLTGTLHLGRTNRFFLGGGKALLNAYYRKAESLGVHVLYDTCVTALDIDSEICRTLQVSAAGRDYRIRTKAVVCASGGFEANIDWLRRYWGDAVDNYIIRGTPFNDGMILSQLLDLGAMPRGQEKGFHAVAVDARSPRFDGGIATRLDSIPFGIVVDRSARRFQDEGEDIWPKRYASWGRHIAERPGQEAYALWDSQVSNLFLPPMYGSIEAGSIAELGTRLGLDGARLETEVRDYNAAVRTGTFDPKRLDDCHTEGLSVPKSHWAQRLDTPPYFAVAVRPGITFTYLGVAVDDLGRIRLQNGDSLKNVYAAGEIMSGNILSSGYLAGFGMTIGSVWGRIAGSGAATHVN